MSIPLIVHFYLHSEASQILTEPVQFVEPDYSSENLCSLTLSEQRNTRLCSLRAANADYNASSRIRMGPEAGKISGFGPFCVIHIHAGLSFV